MLNNVKSSLLQTLSKDSLYLYGTTGWVIRKKVGTVHANLLCGRSASVRTDDYHEG